MALGVQTQQIQISGKNLANVDNPDYARQKVVYGSPGTYETPQGSQDLGLVVKSIQSIRDPLLDAQVVRETGLTSSYTAQQTALEKAQADLGQTVDGASSTDTTSTNATSSGIGASITSLFNSFSAVAANPTDSGSRATLLANAQTLTDQFNSVDSRLSQLQSDLTTQTTSDVADANAILAQIADLNSQIGRAEINNPGSAVDLRDQRQAALEKLSKDIAVTATNDPSNPSELIITAKDGSGNPITLVNKTTVTGLTFNGTTVSGGSPSTALSLEGGSIQGNLTARDGAIQDLRDNLDALANQLVTSVNAAYNPTGTTGNFFDPTKTTAGTITVLSSVTPANLKASDGGAAGDNTIATAVAALANTKFSVAGGDAIDGTFSDSYASTVSSLGQSLSSVDEAVTDQNNILSLVTAQRQSVSGVSLDEEMTNLMSYQRSYEASSRVISVINELLQNLVNLGKN
jgi:flagellar hook-associated protein 1 FlgK